MCDGRAVFIACAVTRAQIRATVSDSPVLEVKEVVGPVLHVPLPDIPSISCPEVQDAGLNEDGKTSGDPRIYGGLGNSDCLQGASFMLDDMFCVFVHVRYVHSMPVTLLPPFAVAHCGRGASFMLDDMFCVFVHSQRDVETLTHLQLEIRARFSVCVRRSLQSKGKAEQQQQLRRTPAASANRTGACDSVNNSRTLFLIQSYSSIPVPDIVDEIVPSGN
ncbi:uncharacterized protein V6R79_018676 [Siganus canaliculatus]